MTKERFAQGMTLNQYIGQMTENKDQFVGALNRATVEEGERQVLERLGSPRKVLIITEDWCGTSLAYVPFVARLVEDHDDIELRIFRRDLNPDVMDQYLKDGVYRSIPVIVFFDEHMNELARFIEQRPT